MVGAERGAHAHLERNSESVTGVCAPRVSTKYQNVTSPARDSRDVEPTAETVGAIVCASYRIESLGPAPVPRCRPFVYLVRVREPCVSRLSPVFLTVHYPIFCDEPL